MTGLLHPFTFSKGMRKGLLTSQKSSYEQGYQEDHQDLSYLEGS
jgi:hypothetical protein